jgi:hypothetical protein
MALRTEEALMDIQPRRVFWSPIHTARDCELLPSLHPAQDASRADITHDITYNLQWPRKLNEFISI